MLANSVGLMRATGQLIDYLTSGQAMLMAAASPDIKALAVASLPLDLITSALLLFAKRLLQ